MLKQPEATTTASITPRRLTQESLSNRREQLVAQRNANPRQIIVSAGTCGEARGALAVASALRKELANQKLADEVLLRVTGCHGFCEQEPMVLIQPGNLLYCHVRPCDASAVVSQTVVRGKTIDRLLYTDPYSGDKLHSETSIPYYAVQARLLLDQHKWLDPKSLDDAIANDGYSALADVLATANSQQVIEEIKHSGLGGRTDNGLLLGQIWESIRIAENAPQKHIICGVDEDAPAAHIDRTILESNPHAVLEGMIIGAYVTGAHAGQIRLRDEHRLALRHAQLAVENARQYGLLGTNILDSGFAFDVDVIRDTYEPASRASRDTESKLRERQTSFESAETWARIPGIINNGAAWFANWGFGGCTGAKILSLSGPIKNTGFIEVPLGMSLRTIVFDIGGGIRNGHKLKAVQIGGPAGSCLPVRKFNASVNCRSLTKAGSVVGSGGIVAMGRETCMVDVARRSLEFLQKKSCGKCAFCRDTLSRMLAIVTDITEGRGHSEHLGLLETLAQSGNNTSSCTLGKTASHSVLSTLKYFRSEYDAHIQDGRCPAGVCLASVCYTIEGQPDK